MKKILLGFILGGLIFGSIGIYAASLYYAKDISYEPTDASWEVSNVSDAINSLYSVVTELDDIKGLGNADASQILNGQTAVVKGSTITGTMIDNGAWTNTPTSSGKVTIPVGYHNGSGYVDTTSVYNEGYNAGKAAPPAYTTKQLSFSFSVGADRSNDYTLDFSPYFSTMVGITNVSFPAGGFSAPSSIGVNTGSKKVSVRVKAIADSSGTVTVTGYGIAK